MVVHWPAMLWHHLATGLAGRLRHPRAAVRLDGCDRALSLHFHALGGDPSHGVTADSGPGGSLTGGTHRGNDLLAWLDRDRMHLPERINRFPTQSLNRELYFWLAAFFALDRALDGEDRLPGGLRHLFRGLATTARVLEKFPSLAPRYRRLCAAELAERRDALPALGNPSGQPAHQIEAAIRYALGSAVPPGDPWLAASVDEARRGACPPPPPHWGRLPIPFLPVFLWGCPRTEVSGLRLRWLKRRRRRRARGSSRSLARPRFESGRQGGPPAGASSPGEHLYREWDCRAGAYRPRWCRGHRASAAVERPRGLRPGRDRAGRSGAAPVRDPARGPWMDARSRERRRGGSRRVRRLRRRPAKPRRAQLAAVSPARAPGAGPGGRGRAGHVALHRGMDRRAPGDRDRAAVDGGAGGGALRRRRRVRPCTDSRATAGCACAAIG